ncbi:MAG TPA: acyl-CoA thioester hydrolase/BAAT C-terminal domain-containing protein [Actinomycetes bacterium]|jgi:dienelactone hydrolase|nr:acyl-CoA thioester hydrolase/BAAT C-terminal domain-containing protein [Actinomycetes bacterium]
MAAHARSWRGRQIGVLTALVVAAAVLARCTLPRYPAAVRPSMSVSPQTALLDQPVTVSVRGLPAGARATVAATATDAGGTTWSASAQFQATSAGVVSLDQPSLGGSYAGVNPMGLFELMAPPPDSTPTVFLSPDAGYDVTLQATVGGRVAAGATARRQGPAAVGVVEKELRPARGEIYGNLYLPKNTAARRPAVLVFGGSDGGLSISFAAALLAAHGYPSLALAYFNEPGLPQGLDNIRLEYFTNALGVLRAQPGVDPRHVLVMGASRGGEAALLLGAYFPRLVNGVIAGVPSSVVNPSIPDTTQPAWTLHGRPLPAVSPSDFWRPTPPGKPQAVIAVERIRGPVLLTCGALDLRWPSCDHTDAITARLAARQFAYPVTALRYPDAGHLVGGLTAYFNSLTDDALTTFGGTVAGVQAAQADAHAKLLVFLASQ